MANAKAPVHEPSEAAAGKAIDFADLTKAASEFRLSWTAIQDGKKGHALKHAGQGSVHLGDAWIDWAGEGELNTMAKAEASLTSEQSAFIAECEADADNGVVRLLDRFDSESKSAKGTKDGPGAKSVGGAILMPLMLAALRRLLYKWLEK